MTQAGSTTGAGADAAGIYADPAEMQRVWRDHRRWVAAILLAHKPREADLDDLLQVVAVSVVRKIGELRDPGALKPWLRTVAINAARAAGRETQRGRRKLKLVRHELSAGQTPRSEPTSPDTETATLEEGRRLMDLARTLPEGYREPLLLRCVQGMSYRQISEITGLPETTIETRIARGRRMLRDLASKSPKDNDAETKKPGTRPGTRPAASATA